MERLGRINSDTGPFRDAMSQVGASCAKPRVLAVSDTSVTVASAIAVLEL